MKSKLKKFKDIFQEEGLFATLGYCANFLIAKTGWFKDKPFFGRLIEKRGNIAHLDNCTFILDSPLISTKIKSRFMLGRYEREERSAVRRFLNSSLPVIELGASIGVLSCITNKKLRNPKEHVVVEANPELISILEKNREKNACSFSILNKAVGYEGDSMTFYVHERFLSGSAYRKTEKSIIIPSITLQHIMYEKGYKYVNLICDIEGGEVDLVKNEKKLLAEKIFQIIIEVHPSFVGEEKINHLKEDLLAIGFKKIRTGIYSGIYSPVWVFENTNLVPHL